MSIPLSRTHDATLLLSLSETGPRILVIVGNVYIGVHLKGPLVSNLNLNGSGLASQVNSPAGGLARIRQGCFLMGCQGWSHARLIAVGALSSVRHRTLGLTRVQVPYDPPSFISL